MTTNKTTVIMNPASPSISIDGVEKYCYPSPHGLRCHLTHADVRALGIEPSPDENYELLSGDTLRTLSGPRRGHIEKLALPLLRYDPAALATHTLIDALAPPQKTARPFARARRTMGRKWLPLIDSIRRLDLPADHDVMVTLAKLLRVE